MDEAWIWYGPSDPVSLDDICQTGAKSISTALYEVPAGKVWSLEDILERKHLIEKSGLSWSVVESIPVHEVIKIGRPEELWRTYVDNYKESLSNLGKAGLKILSYSFMPMFDWLRTDIDYPWHDGSTALAFSMDKFRVFDIHILKREGATSCYTLQEVNRARQHFEAMSLDEIDKLSKTLIDGLHGQQGYSLESFRFELNRWKGVDKKILSANLLKFLSELLVVAECWNINLSLHPDDPPCSILGLPNVASTLDDYQYLFSSLPSQHNGMTFCMGSLVSRSDNNIMEILKRLKSRIKFVHLRNVMKTEDGGLVESGHLEGDADLVGVIKELILEKKERDIKGIKANLPMRSDHGHLIKFGSWTEKTIPGHSVIGRMRGLAEIRGIQAAIQNILNV